MEFFKMLVCLSIVLSTAADDQCDKGTQTGQGQEADLSKMGKIRCCGRIHRCFREWTPSTGTLTLGCSPARIWPGFVKLFGPNTYNRKVGCGVTTTLYKGSYEPVTLCLCKEDLCNAQSNDTIGPIKPA